MTAGFGPDKGRVLAALRDRLSEDLRTAAESQQRTQSGATHEESRPENDKDTRALEASYLARGQAQRVAELRNAVTSMAALSLRPFNAGDGAALSALIEVEEGEQRRLYFLAPAGGGLELELDGVKVRIVTPQSPLGRALLGRRPGDWVEVRTPQGLREYEISAVS